MRRLKNAEAAEAEIFALKETLNVWQWNEKHVSLSSRITPMPGPYRTSFCPYVKAPQEDFTDPDVRDIVMCFATRCSKSEIILNCIRYTVAVDPAPWMFILATEAQARSVSENRLQPSLIENEIFKAKLPLNPDKFKLLEMFFKDCTGWMAGANSPANLSQRGVAKLFCDEIDKWPGATEKEAGALDLAFERTKDRADRKHVIASTPTVESGQIFREFKLGDQRYYFVPCPHCGGFQTLKLKQVRWPEEAKTETGAWDLEKVKKNTWYECEICQKRITNAHKPDMLAKGEWRPTATGKEPGRRSYHLSSLYPAWIQFSRVAVQFLQCKDTPSMLQSFVNSWLAEPFYEYGNQKEQDEHIAKAAVEVVEGVPKGFRTIMTVDVQSNNLWYVVRGHNKDKESIRLDFGSLPDFVEAKVVQDKWKPSIIGCDSGFRPQIVLEWCAANPGWIPTLGSGALFSSMRWVLVPIEGAEQKGAKIRKFIYRPNDWKEMLNDRMQGNGPKWSISGDPGAVYLAQMKAEHRKVRRGARGQTTIEWIKHNNENHAWDLETLQVALFEAVRPFIFDVVADTVAPSPQMSAEDMERHQLQEMRNNLTQGEQLQW
jgi:phage terminase large subunit GpA-like protein